MAFFGIIWAADSRRRRYRQRYALRYLRDADNVWEVSDEIFIKNFRLTKNVMKDLIELLEPHAETHTASWSIPFYLRVLAAIHFFGHGSYQTDLIIKHATPKYVNFPKTSSERDENKKRYMLHHFILYEVWHAWHFGCIDCTHISIVAPKKDHPVAPAAIYMNRKGYYSINIEVICDADERILFASSRYPGSTHDAAIWKVSTVRALLTHKADDGTYLLGDSGYPLEHCLLTPYRTSVGSTQEKYNRFHKKTRNVIERTFDVVKSRFRCLHRHRTLHYTPDMAGKIVYAVFTLHNICRENNIPLDEELTEYSDDFGNEVLRQIIWHITSEILMPED
ncbi:putative nuclease HARBI1, partial [Ctenocephalides felis]|uniref:putative nuclease HARBI1 n=1 Tax=Ctenocephalides felis TaxID=7515 RepID=UPI000E6E3F9C